MSVCVCFGWFMRVSWFSAGWKQIVEIIRVPFLQSIDDASDRFDGDKHLEWRMMMRLSKSSSESAVVVDSDNYNGSEGVLDSCE